MFPVSGVMQVDMMPGVRHVTRATVEAVVYGETLWRAAYVRK